MHNNLNSLIKRGISTLVLTVFTLFICIAGVHDNNIAETMDDPEIQTKSQSISLDTSNDSHSSIAGSALKMHDILKESNNIALYNNCIENDSKDNDKKKHKICVRDIKWKVGYTDCTANVRSKPNTKSKVIKTLSFNEKIKYSKYNSDWYYFKNGKKVAYIHKSLISKNKSNYSSLTLWSSGFKSYMPYTAITATYSPQWELQQSYAYTGNYGIRQVNGRYCVAVGSAATSEIGVYFDLVLKNGTVIPCVLADQKANKDTLSDNLTTAGNGCVSEFLVDSGSLNHNAKRVGDISACTSEWNSPVVEIRIYKNNVMK